MGRKKITLKKTDYSKISRLAERGVSEVDICEALGISFPTWARLKKEDEKALEAFETARRKEERELVGVLYEKAMNGDSTCAMFLLKTRHGYLEGKEVVNANAVNVQITLPGSMQPEDYKKQLEVENE